MPQRQALSAQHVTEVSSVGRVLADETRVRILAYLSAGEACVCDIVDAVGISQPLLSHHLRALKAAGLVRDRREGRWNYYSVVSEPFSVISELIARLGNGRLSPKRRTCK